jgi:hypothetical protein
LAQPRVSEKIRRNDKVLLWIECLAWSNQKLRIVVIAPEVLKRKNGVVAAGVKRSKRYVRDLKIVYRLTTLKPEATKGCYLVLRLLPASVRARCRRAGKG